MEEEDVTFGSDVTQGEDLGQDGEWDENDVISPVSALLIKLNRIGVSSRLLDLLTVELRAVRVPFGPDDKFWSNCCKLEEGWSGVVGHGERLSREMDDLSRYIRRPRVQRRYLDGYPVIKSVFQKLSIGNVTMELGTGDITISSMDDRVLGSVSYSPNGELTAVTGCVTDTCGFLARPKPGGFATRLLCAAFKGGVNHEPPTMKLGTGMFADMAAILKTGTHARGVLHKRLLTVILAADRAFDVNAGVDKSLQAVRSVHGFPNAVSAVNAYKLAGASAVPLIDNIIAATHSGALVQATNASAGSIAAWMDIVEGLRKYREKDEDASKHGLGGRGSHAAEVLRKQIIPLEDMGMFASGSPEGVVIGAGDSNLSFVAGLRARLTDLRIVPGLDRLDALADDTEWVSKVPVFSDAYASAAGATDYWAKHPLHENQLSTNRPGQAPRAKGVSTPTPFERSFCFAHTLARNHVSMFAVKIVLGPDAPAALARLHTTYGITIYPGGRGHNGELVILCRARAVYTDPPLEAPLEMKWWVAIVCRYLMYAVSVNMRRFKAELILELPAYEVPLFVNPAVWYLLDGKLKLARISPTPILERYEREVTLTGGQLRLTRPNDGGTEQGEEPVLEFADDEDDGIEVPPFIADRRPVPMLDEALPTHDGNDEDDQEAPPLVLRGVLPPPPITPLPHAGGVPVG